MKMDNKTFRTILIIVLVLWLLRKCRPATKPRPPVKPSPTDRICEGSRSQQDCEMGRGVWFWDYKENCWRCRGDRII